MQQIFNFANWATSWDAKTSSCKTNIKNTTHSITENNNVLKVSNSKHTKYTVRASTQKLSEVK